jgi:signal transduction histidine kinase
MTPDRVPTESDQRLERALVVFVRQEFGVPIEVIIGISDILIQDARRDHDDLLLQDLERIRSAGALLREELGRLLNLALQDSFAKQENLSQIKAKLRHDLRTPLNAVKGYSELILEDARDSGRELLLSDMEKILGAVDQLLKQVDRLVAMTDPAALGSSESLPLFVMPPRDLIGHIMDVDALDYDYAQPESRAIERHPRRRRYSRQSRIARASVEPRRTRGQHD